MRARSLLSVCLAALLGMSGCTGGSGAGVDMAGERFLPEEVALKAGTEITFTNGSAEAHSVTAYEEGLPPGANYFASGGFESEAEARADIAASLLRPGETFSVTLTEPGTYRYFCIPHEDGGMVGRIVVER